MDCVMQINMSDVMVYIRVFDYRGRIMKTGSENILQITLPKTIKSKSHRNSINM